MAQYLGVGNGVRLYIKHVRAVHVVASAIMAVVRDVQPATLA